jgi:hypothetical protein
LVTTYQINSMGANGMAGTPPKDSQVHVRVGSDLKRALKMFCVREGTTEQSWLTELIELELSKRAPDLWSSGGGRKREAKR